MTASLSHAWRALRHRNFRLFVFGQSISVTGTWLTRLATMWLVYRLTHSALLLGVVSFAGQIVTFAAGPFAGVWVERLDRRQLLIWVQAIAAAQSLVLAAATLTNAITLWEIISLTVLGGLTGALGVPGRLSFVAQMVDDRNDVDNAIAILSSINNGARLIGPTIAGLMIASFGEGWCFLIDGISFLPVIASLALMRIEPVERRRRSRGMLFEMHEGWSYVRTFRPLRSILLFFALVSLLGYSYAVLLPVFAGQVLHGGPTTLGWLNSASGIGALASTVSLALRRSVAGLARLVQIAAALLGIALMLFGLSHLLWLSLVLMVLVGFGLMQSVAASNTIILSLAPEDMRARVMSYYTMAFFGGAPFGSLLASVLADRIGASNTLVLTGAACTAVSMFFALELPQVAAALLKVRT
ncbi:MAG TPA: MFS transporter [Steroidobacteraceae bacterium]